MRMRHRHAALEWARVLDQTDSRCAAQGGDPAPLGRSIDVASLPPDAALFHWPDNSGDLIVLICPSPTCTIGTFTSEALRRRNQALDHFLRHGLDLADEQHMVQLFGFKGMASILTTFGISL